MKNKTKIIMLKGEELKSIDLVHKILKYELKLPEYYGNNLDALWDCLTGWMEMPVTIIWKNYDISKQQLGNYAYKLKKLFQEASNNTEGFDFKLEE